MMSATYKSESQYCNEWVGSNTGTTNLNDETGEKGRVNRCERGEEEDCTNNNKPQTSPGRNENAE